MDDNDDISSHFKVIQFVLLIKNTVICTINLHIKIYTGDYTLYGLMTTWRTQTQKKDTNNKERTTTQVKNSVKLALV